MSAYSCHNKPRPIPGSTYKAQSSWKVWQNTRKPVYVDIRSTFDLAECQYTKDHVNDPQCAGCAHRAGEAA